MKSTIHPTQERLLDLLAKNVDDPLTIRELQETLNLSSTSVVMHHINQLEKKGYLKRNQADPRDYHVLTGSPEKPVAYIGLYGLGKCGPSGYLLDGNPVERMPIPIRVIDFPISEAFLVKASGDSMEPTIYEGDLIVAKKNNLIKENSGKTVVCVNKGEALIKKMTVSDQAIILSSYNDKKYSPFNASIDNFRVEGVVRSVIFRRIR